MKFQVFFAAVVVLAICATGSAQVPQLGSTALGPPSFCEIQLSILQSEASKISTPELDEDLQLRIDNVLTNAPTGCAGCDGLPVWLNKVCVVINLRSGLNQLSQIKTEAIARANAATTSTEIPAQ